LCLIHVVAHDTHGIKGPVCEHTVDDDGRRERSSGKDEVDDNHRPARFQKNSGAFLKRSAGILSSPDAFLLAILFMKRLNSLNVATGYPSLSSLPIVL